MHFFVNLCHPWLSSIFTVRVSKAGVQISKIYSISTVSLYNIKYLTHIKLCMSKFWVLKLKRLANEIFYRIISILLKLLEYSFNFKWQFISDDRRHLTYFAVTCSHQRAWQLYVESVTNPYGFPASRCSQRLIRKTRRSCAQRPIIYMGFAANLRARGMFYLQTNSQPPYGRNTTSLRCYNYRVNARKPPWFCM